MKRLGSVCLRKGEYSRVRSKQASNKAKVCEALALCQRAFETQTSKGSMQIGFIGCHQIEDKLTAEGLVVYATQEKVSGVTDPYNDQVKNKLDFHHLVEFASLSYFNGLKEELYSDYEIDFEAYSSLRVRFIEYYIRLDLKKSSVKKKHSSKRFTHLMNHVLTSKQKQVVEAYYVDNPQKISQKRVASKIGMNPHTFKDHLKAANKKIRNYYSDRTPKKSMKISQRDLYYDFWRKSSHEDIKPLTYIRDGKTQLVAPDKLEEFRKQQKRHQGPKRRWLYNDEDKIGPVLEPKKSFNHWLADDCKKHRKQPLLKLSKWEREIGPRDEDELI